MGIYAIRRSLYIIPTVVGVAFIVYCIMSLTPGDPGRLLLGLSADQSAVDAMNEELGYNRPFFIRFFDYLANLAQGDLGVSYRTRTSFTGDLFSRLPVTLTLGLWALAVSTIIGVLIGVLAAVKQGSALDVQSTVTALLFASVPTFFVGLLLIYVFAVTLHWLPASGVSSPAGYILPVLTLTAGTVAVVMRFARTTMLDAIRQDYVRTARAKGASEARTILKHTLKNALIPIITLVGVSFGAVVGGSVIVENIFNLPGVGNYLLVAIRAKDMPIVLSCTVVLAVFFCIVMLLVDILHAVVDPRVRQRYQNRRQA
ncbi:ABC transporter permease [Microbacterium sp. SSM24]|uniref:ABC transporter permease n=1 Tax=Microbacterium sp. SSM24 TaxID=2991714 RepID=UPI002226F459|nr:ABC transporter permease [Microbacterium sp. SSM24]MCW3492613.1 ABC transporter permease [Microbacterium sp. SSM24]